MAAGVFDICRHFLHIEGAIFKAVLRKIKLLNLWHVDCFFSFYVRYAEDRSAQRQEGKVYISDGGEIRQVCSE